MSSPSPSSNPSAPATNTTAPPPSTPSAPPPSTPAAPPPSTPAAPPPSTPSAPPPETPSPPPPETPPPPPPATPSPPPTTPSAPPPTTPSAPPPTTPSAPPPTTPSAPPPATPSPPPSPTTPSTPPTSTPSPPPPPTPSPPSPSPPDSPPSPPSPPNPSPPPPKTLPSPSPPLPPSPPSISPPSSDSISTGVIAGIAIGGVAILLILSLLFICYTRRRKRRRNNHTPEQYYIPRPPPPAPKDGYNGGTAQYWQQNIPAPPDQYLMPMPNHPQTPPPPVTNSSGGSGSTYSGSDGPVPAPSPGLALGFSKNAFTYEELSMATNGFSDANLLGQGGFGYVHKGFLSNGKEVAVKSLKAGSGQGEREFQAEVEIISRVHHKHLVSLVGYCISGSQRLLVYEFVPNNNLEFHLHGKDRETVDWPSRLKIAMGSAKGLAYLHEDCHPKIIHRDIKASNILLDFKFEAKVADFGLAKLVPDVNTHISTRVMGTFGYLAPEYASSGKLTEKSDVFSFGVVLLELITGRRPIDNTDSYMAESLVDWARPMLNRATEDDDFDCLADPTLQKRYNQNEMARMVACAAACVRHSARRRPKMSQVVRTLEGDVSLSDLNEGIRPGHSGLHGSYGSSDYDSGLYNEEMRGFRQMAFAGQGLSSGGTTSDYGLNPSGSSSEAQTAREAGAGRIRGDGRGASGASSS